VRKDMYESSGSSYWEWTGIIIIIPYDKAQK